MMPWWLIELTTQAQAALFADACDTFHVPAETGFTVGADYPFTVAADQGSFTVSADRGAFIVPGCGS